MIKWTFFFDEGNVSSTVDKEEEDLRILSLIDTSGIIELPNEKFDLYVNMALVKCTSREVVNAEPATSTEAPIQNTES